MGTESLQYDTGDPMAVQEWTVPAGVYSLSMMVQGGGLWNPFDEVGYHGDHGLIIYSVPVLPGDVLGFLFGGAPDGLTGGTNGGGNGGGGSLLLGFDGYGAGGRTEITRNGVMWMVAGGEGGSVSGANTYLPNLDFYTTVVPPGPDQEPRVPQAAPAFSPPATLLEFTSGRPGGVKDGADGLAAALIGSSGGGGGWGGGASGGYYRWADPFGESWSPQVGKSGGHLVPEGAVYSLPFSWSGLPDNGGHGWAYLEWHPRGRTGWNVGRLGI